MSYHLLPGRRDQPPLTTSCPQVVVESNIWSPLSLLQTEQPQFPQLLPSCFSLASRWARVAGGSPRHLARLRGSGRSPLRLKFSVSECFFCNSHQDLHPAPVTAGPLDKVCVCLSCGAPSPAPSAVQNSGSHQL